MIGPHPDDIEIGAGATVARLAAQGKKVCFLICTDGRFGSANAPDGITGDALASLRMEEARASARVLGVTDAAADRVFALAAPCTAMVRDDHRDAGAAEVVRNVVPACEAREAMA